MNYSITIKQISSKETHQVRHKILRIGQPIESCEFEGDLRSDTLHFGAFNNEGLIGIISCYQNNNSYFKSRINYQIRGVATLEHMQKKGVGKKLMKHAEKKLKEINCSNIWLNARIKANEFYLKLGYTKIGPIFEVPLIGKHQCFFKN